MSYDERCHALALIFLNEYEPLSDEARKILSDELAQDIQNAIENFLRYHFEETS